MLFSAIIKVVYDIEFKKSTHDKRELLERFKNDGYFLLDAVKYPINRDLNGCEVKNKFRINEIEESKLELLEKLDKLRNEGRIDKNTKIILLKETVHRVLYDELIQRGFNVINPEKIGLPMYYGDKDFIDKLKEVIHSGIS